MTHTAEPCKHISSAKRKHVVLKIETVVAVELENFAHGFGPAPQGKMHRSYGLFTPAWQSQLKPQLRPCTQGLSGLPNCSTVAPDPYNFVRFSESDGGVGYGLTACLIVHDQTLLGRDHEASGRS
jgi:hypothetical protein